MNNLNSINLTYNYLSEVYNSTKSDYVRENLIKSQDLKGLNIKSLIKYGFLTEYKDTYKWKGVIPQYFHAYNYYNSVRGKKKDYNYLLSVLNNPENYSTEEIVEALTIKGACTMHGLENSEIITKYESEVINLNDYNIHEAISKGSDLETHTKQMVTPSSNENVLNIELLKIISNKFDLSLKDNEVIKELLGDIVNVVMENTTSVKNSQNSISTVIAILKTNQDNLFDISASQYYIIRELYANLVEAHSNSDDPKINDRINKIGIALQKMKERVDNNVALINRYGGKR